MIYLGVCNEYIYLLPGVVTRVQMSECDHVFSRDAQLLSGVTQLVPAHVQIF